TAHALADKGYSVVRIGNVVEEPLKLDQKKIFDYATSDIQSDFLDIFLMARCKFGIYPDGGVSAISEIFFRPFLIVNYTAFMHLPPYNHNGKVIFKKFKRNDEEQFIPYRKVLSDYPIKELQSTGEWSKFNLEVVSNTEQEILEASLELEELINGGFTPDSCTKKLHNSLWKIVGEPHSDSPVFPIASSFLKRNQHLFE
ncbi:TIGR04372 family glycosyltransferase, partial [Rhodospirillales bacterium]|nr:TIGR04372 family glycosyltransferase [Rhodospirillales bacterium]